MDDDQFHFSIDDGVKKEVVDHIQKVKSKQKERVDKYKNYAKELKQKYKKD